MMEMRGRVVAPPTLPEMGHYEVLGVDPSASMREIRAAYVEAARANHPDRHGGDGPARQEAEERMREINAAWAALGTVEARSTYDRERLESPSTRPRAHGTGAPPAGEWRPYDTGPVAGFDERDDRPITSSALPRWLAMAPPLLLVGGILGFFAGGLSGIAPLVGLAVASVIAAAVLFLVAPLVALSASRREDRSP